MSQKRVTFDNLNIMAHLTGIEAFAKYYNFWQFGQFHVKLQFITLQSKRLYALKVNGPECDFPRARET